MTARKPPVKKAPAKRAAAKKAPAKKPSGGARQRRLPKAEGRPGRKPLVLRGFTWTPGKGDEPGTAVWAPKTPAAEVLAALSIGASWDHAADFAHLNQATPRSWSARGEVAIGEHHDLDHYADTSPDPEHLAYAAFAVAAREARTSPVIGSLDAIDRARRKGDWKAAAHLLRVLPQARDYTEVTRQQVTGVDDGPIAVDLGEHAEQAVLDLAARIAAEAKPDT